MMDFGGKDVAGNENQTGSEDSQDLTSQESGGQPARPERTVVQVGADNVVELPAGTALDTIEVEGRDLVIVLSDGTEIVIPDGAIVVPQIQIGEVTVPPANLAALMIGNEPEPAAGSPQSSGGNFAGAVGDIQAAYGLGDLLPYTELQFPQPEEREIIPYALGEPEIVIETPDNPGGVINAIATVDEAGLPARDGESQGTDEPSNSEVANGTIIFSAPDGVGSVLINGVAITEIGQTFQGEYGTLTITSIDLDGGRIGFFFTLQDNLVGETIDGSFVMTVIDIDGDRADANLQIIVRDDAPIATDDSATQTVEDTPVTVDVFNNDTPGADSVQLTAIAPVEGSLSGSGELVYNGDGTFTYNPVPGEEGTVTFDYTITDGDGSTSTATVTITLQPDSTPTISILEGSDTEVDESGLAFGSDPTSGGDRAEGALTFDTGNDTVASLVIGGVDVTQGGTVQGEFGTLVVTGNPTDGYTYVYTLTVNTDNEAGVQTDTFPVLLTDSDADPAETTLTITIVDDQPVAVADTDSVTEDGPLVASGNVITDAEANGDNGADTLGADGADVVAVDFEGNAGTVGTPLKGAYGELKLDANGNYTYELDNTNPLVQGLDSTETLTEVFSYTLEDGDGDQSVTTLTITINGANDIVTISGLDVPGGELTVDEDDLAAGSSPDPTALVQTSSFTVDSPDGLETLTVGGVAVFGEGVTYPVTVPGTYGEVRITGVTLTTDAAGDVVSAIVDYEYELSNNTTAHLDPGQDTLIDSFAVVAFDTDGSPANASLDVNVIDDIPNAVDNNGGSIEEGGSLGGDVLSNDTAGADGFAASGAIIGVSSVNLGTSDTTANGSGDYVLVGEFGTLTLNKNGSYTYQSNPDSTEVDATESFTYTVIDADGDTSTATLSIDIEDVTGVVFDNDVIVNEAGLPNGSDAASDSEIDADGQITVTGATGTLTYVLTGANSDGDGQYGTLVLNGSTGQYTYTLDTPYTDGDTTENTTNTVNGAEAFTYDVFDDLGNLIGSGTINVNIIDDIPQALANATVLLDDDALSGGNPGGTGDNVDSANTSGTLGADFGADGAGSFAFLTTGAPSGFTYVASGNDILVQQNQGGSDVTVLTVTLNTATGAYTVTQNNNILHADGNDENNQPFTLTYQVTDADDDTATGTLSINVDDDTPQVSNAQIASSVDVDETDAGSLAGYPISDTSAAAMVSFSGSFGADGAATSNATVYTIAIVGDGTTSLQTAQGDMPITLVQTSANTITGVYDVDDKTAFTVVINPNGTVTLTQDVPLEHLIDGGPGAAHNDTLSLGGLIEATVTLTDADGDTASDSAQIGGGITFYDDGPQALANATVLLDDDALSGGNPGGTGDNVDSANTSGTLGADFGADGVGSFAFLTTGAPSGFTYVASGNDILVQQNQGGSDVTVLTVTLNTATGAYTVTQNNNILHADGNDENNQPFTLTYQVTDADDDTATGTLSINVDDDTPQVSNAQIASSVDVDETDAGSLAGYPISDTSAAAMVSFSGSFGADGAATSNATVYTIAIVGDGTTSLQTAQGDMPITLVQTSANTITGVYDVDDKTAFTVVINPNGTVTLTQDVPLEHLIDGGPGAAHNDTLSLGGLIEATVTLTDADGDTASDSAQIGGGITFYDDGPQAQDDTNSLTEDTASVGGNVLTDGTADSFGGDGPGSPQITAVSGTAAGTVGGDTQGSWGTLELGTDGQYTYTLTADMQYLADGESETDTFTYTIIDSDGDTSTATLLITINGANDAPTIDSASVAVSDEGFATGNPDMVGDPSDTSNSTQFLTGDLNVADADTTDSLEVTLGTPSAGLPIKITDGATGTELLWQTQDNDHKLVGYVSDPSDPSVVIVVADDGTFTVEIFDPIYHSNTSSEDIDTFTIPVSVSDGTTSNVVPATITVTLEDDSPVIGVFSPASTSVDNQDGATAPGTFEYSPGGDNHGEFSITYTGTPIDGVSYSTVQIDSDMDGINDSAILTASAGGQDLYTLQVNTDGTYLFTLENAEVAVQEDISFANLSAGGPGFRELLDDDTTSVDETGRVEFFVDDPATDPEVNANNNNFGVGDTHLDIGEHFNMEFHNPGTLGDDPAGTNAEYLSALAINVNTLKNSPGNIGPNVTLEWTATNTGTGQTETGTVLVTSTGDVLIDPTIEFNELRIENVNTASPTDGARIQIGGVTVFKTILPSDQLLDFEISASDRDDDVTAVSDLSVLIDTSGSSSSSTLSTASFDVSPLSMTTMLDSTMAHAVNDSFQQGDTFADLAFSSRMGDRAAGIASMAAAASAFAMHTTISSSHTRAFSDGGVSHEVAQISVDTLAAHAPTQAEGFAGIQSVIDAEPDMQLANAPTASSRLLDAMEQPHDGPSVMATADEDGFARVYDLGGEHSPAPVFDFASHPVAVMDAASGAGMEALLLMAAEGKGPVEGGAVADAADALTTMTQEAAVDHVIDFFAQADGDHGAGPAVSITHDAGMTALLDAKIDVGDVAAHAAVPVDDMAMALDAIASA